MSGRQTLRKGEKALPAVRANVGLSVEYRRRIQREIDEMAASVIYWVGSAYRQNEPRMAQDALPASVMQTVIERMIRRWRKKFDTGADRLADWFATKVEQRSTATLKKILRDAGFSVQFQMTPAMRDVLEATIQQQVGLIRSIPEQYLAQVQGSVMRSVQAGRDLGSLVEDLQKHRGVARRRAETIARSQNNMATAVITRARQAEAGIEEAVWLHSHGGREPRPTHLGNTGNRYKISEGWYDPDPKVRKHIWPGELINCRCVAKAVVKGFS